MRKRLLDLSKTGRGKLSFACVAIVVLSFAAQFTDSRLPWNQWCVSAIMWLVIAYFISAKRSKYQKADKAEIWRRWAQCESSIDQIRRIERARTEGFNYKSEDVENGRAVFIGGAGKYSTTLQACSCPDFKKRRLPCKHMYRLAADMNLQDLERED